VRDYTKITPTKKACRPKDAQAFDCLVAKGGIERPTQGFSGPRSITSLFLIRAITQDLPPSGLRGA
jgi:hypothetical protein